MLAHAAGTVTTDACLALGTADEVPWRDAAHVTAGGEHQAAPEYPGSNGSPGWALGRRSHCACSVPGTDRRGKHLDRDLAGPAWTTRPRSQRRLPGPRDDDLERGDHAAAPARGAQGRAAAVDHLGPCQRRIRPFVPAGGESAVQSGQDQLLGSLAHRVSIVPHSCASSRLQWRRAARSRESVPTLSGSHGTGARLQDDDRRPGVRSAPCEQRVTRKDPDGA